MKPEGWNAQAAARAFEIAGTVESVTPYGSGHINDTFLVVSADGPRRERNVLQRINHEVFHHPEQLMENVERVSAHQEGLAGSIHQGSDRVALRPSRRA